MNMTTPAKYRAEARERFVERDALLRRLSRLDRNDPESRDAARELTEQAQHAEYCAYEAERWADWEASQ